MPIVAAALVGLGGMHWKMGCSHMRKGSKPKGTSTQTRLAQDHMGPTGGSQQTGDEPELGKAML